MAVQINDWYFWCKYHQIKQESRLHRIHEYRVGENWCRRGLGTRFSSSAVSCLLSPLPSHSRWWCGTIHTQAHMAWASSTLLGAELGASWGWQSYFIEERSVTRGAHLLVAVPLNAGGSEQPGSPSRVALAGVIGLV